MWTGHLLHFAASKGLEFRVGGMGPRAAQVPAGTPGMISLSASMKAKASEAPNPNPWLQAQVQIVRGHILDLRPVPDSMVKVPLEGSLKRRGLRKSLR